MLVDLLSIGKSGYASSKARSKYVQMSSSAKVLRFAIVGGNVLIRTMAGFIIRAAGRGDSVRWFDDREEALAWLDGGI
jgi:hypothetical protein